ncbi:uncharacterized protein C9orf40 homolog isoform X1 [Sylvia atricapilla]|uniref:uncharacterized protein C9orf40 homolog isoform X1 n=1 Tax=Sylvia atricapilla TaxID=48155 RepID=UPI00339A1547
MRRRGTRPLGAAGARPLMAKRRAETLMCHVPVKRLLREPALPRAGERRSRAEPGPAGPAAPKRPLEEAEAPPGKRLGPGAPRAQPAAAGGGRRQRGGTAEPRDAAAEEGRAGGRGEERTAAEAKEVSSTFTRPSLLRPMKWMGNSLSTLPEVMLSFRPVQQCSGSFQKFFWCRLRCVRLRFRLTTAPAS